MTNHPTNRETVFAVICLALFAIVFCVVAVATMIRTNRDVDQFERNLPTTTTLPAGLSL